MSQVNATGPAAPRPPAVVIGLGPGGLGVVRSLDRLGVDVHGVYSATGGEVGRHSRLLRARWPVRDLGSDTKLMAALKEIRRRVSPRERMILIPAHDSSALFVTRHSQELAEDFVLRVPPCEIGTAFLDKRATVGVCVKNGIAIPPTCVPDHPEDIEQAARRFGFPVMVKPALQDDPGFPGKNAIMASAEELVAFYAARPELVRRTVIQELIRSGDGHILGINTYSGSDGRVIACVSHRRLRQWLPDRGATSFGVTETITSLRESTVRFLDAIGYVGFAGVEYAEDTETGEHHFLELNARVVLPNQLFADAGVDLTAVGYLEMCGQSTPRAPTQRDGVYWMDLPRDAPSSFVHWRRGQLGFRQWLGDLRMVTSHATLAARDPKPFAAALVALAEAAVGRRRGRQGVSVRSLSDLYRRP